MYRVSAAAAVPAVGTTTGDCECVWSVGGLKLGVARPGKCGGSRTGRVTTRSLNAPSPPPGEMSILAEQYLEVHGNTYNFANVDKHRHNLVGQQQSKYPDRSNVGLDRRTSHKEDTPSVVKVDTKSTYHRDTRTCYLCNKAGHIARDCRVVKKPILASQSSAKAMHASVKSDECIILAHERVGDDQRVTIDNGSRGVQTRELSTESDTPVANMSVVEGRICGRTGNVSVLRDTGCSGGIIRRSMSSEDSFTGETRTCVMLNGDTFRAPVVNIMVDTPYFTGRFNALSVEKPVYDICGGKYTRRAGCE